MNIEAFNHYFFIGIAGTGMSAIAQYLKGIGKNVAGSDRLFNHDNKMLIQEQFEKAGIECFLQNGSGISASTEVVIVSTAIEERNIEYRKAMDMGIPVMKRSELLAAISLSKKTIAIGGTSGKSTTTAMVFHILQECGYSPSLMTGAGLTALQKQGLPGNAWVGNSEWLVIESDESDGSIVNYYPEVSVVLNIDRDHKELDELMHLFSTFKEHTRKTFIVNRDDKLISSLSQNPVHDFATGSGAGFTGSDFKQGDFRIHFTINEVPFTIPVIGRHNMENAMAATATCAAVGNRIEDSARALESFQGIYRRTQLIGVKRGVFVIDDFAHNPREIAAAIKACQHIGTRVFAWFQPHGYGPLSFMYEELVQTIPGILRDGDLFVMSEVYYAGGTVNREINSEIVVQAMQKQNERVRLINDRSNLHELLQNSVQSGDVILLMGARDPSLSDFASAIFAKL